MKVPGFFAGRVGFQFACRQRNDFGIAVHEADEDLGDDPGADRPQPLAVLADVRLLQDVIPKRRRLMQAELLGDGAIVAARDLVRGQRILDAHRLGDILAGRQAEIDAALQVAEGEVASSPGSLCRTSTRRGSIRRAWLSVRPPPGGVLKS